MPSLHDLDLIFQMTAHLQATVSVRQAVSLLVRVVSCCINMKC